MARHPIAGGSKKPARQGNRAGTRKLSTTAITGRDYCPSSVGPGPEKVHCCLDRGCPARSCRADRSAHRHARRLRDPDWPEAAYCRCPTCLTGRGRCHVPDRHRTAGRSRLARWLRHRPAHYWTSQARSWSGRRSLQTPADPAAAGT